MTRIDLSDEEEDVLRKILEAQVNNLVLEISHTDHADFKAMLKHRREILCALLARFPEVQAASVA